MKYLTVLALCVSLAACGGSGSSTTTPVVQQRNSNIVAFMGDDIMDYWRDYSDAFPQVGVSNFGAAGDTVASVQAKFQADVIQSLPQVGTVVIVVGMNDLIQGLDTRVSIGNLKLIAAQAKTAGIHVILSSVTYNDKIPNATVDVWNQGILTLCSENGYLFADFNHVTTIQTGPLAGTPDASLFVDGLIPNFSGYYDMWQELAPLIKEDQDFTLNNS